MQETKADSDKEIGKETSITEDGYKEAFYPVENGISENEFQEYAENEQKNIIENESPYSETINKFIRTLEELKIYIENGLVETKIGDKIFLINLDKINLDQKDAMGRTNLERMEQGLAPLDENGEPYNLHHIGQKPDSPLAVLTNECHKKNDGILHDKTKRTEVHGEGSTWPSERARCWKDIAEKIKSGEIK